MNAQDRNSVVGAAMVVGGGIGGMQAALDLADAGIKVYLVETKSAIGGRMAQLDKTFPTNDCAMCTMAPRLVEIGRHRDIEILTLSESNGWRGRPETSRSRSSGVRGSWTRADAPAAGYAPIPAR